MRILLTGFMLILLSCSFAQPKKIVAESTIQNVTVFSSGARVQRSAILNIQPGRTEISFEGLSNQLDQQTIQLKADANITLLSVQTAKDYLTARKIDVEERNMIDKINMLKDKFDLENKLLDVYKNEEAMLIKNQSIGGDSGVKTAELKDALDLQRLRLTEIYSRELEIQKHLTSELHELDRLRAQVNEISKKKDSVSYIVTALLDSRETRAVNFQLLYNVKDAGWFPAYDIRVTDVSKPLRVLMNANVFQRSGESWKNISLLLSTGNPKDNATPPLLQPWLLGFYDPSVSLRTGGPKGLLTGRVTDIQGQPVAFATVKLKQYNMATTTDVNGFFKLNNVSGDDIVEVSLVGFESKEMVVQPGFTEIQLQNSTSSLNDVVVIGYGVSDGLQGSASGVEVGRYKKAERIQTVKVVTQFQPTTTVYKIDEKYSLETDGKTTTIGIKEFEIPAIYDYYASPKIDPSAFLTARIINWQDYNLQSGEASLYFEGSYLGKTYIDLGSVADTLSLSLGKDNAVKVSRKLIKEYSSRKFIGSNRTENKEYEISIRNSKDVPVDIEILDQIPVSTTKEIEVEDIKVSDAQINKETGILNWIFTLTAGQEKKLRIVYSVKYPKDKKLVLE
jgi:Domain of unknown function (DUF4139)/N-terminal domain of unknown function (DUF4140)